MQRNTWVYMYSNMRKDSSSEGGGALSEESRRILLQALLQVRYIYRLTEPTRRLVGLLAYLVNVILIQQRTCTILQCNNTWCQGSARGAEDLQYHRSRVAAKRHIRDGGNSTPVSMTTTYWVLSTSMTFFASPSTTTTLSPTHLLLVAQL